MRDTISSIDIDDTNENCYRKFACELNPQADYASIMLISLANLYSMKSHVARIVTRVQLLPLPLHVSR